MDWEVVDPVVPAARSGTAGGDPSKDGGGGMRTGWDFVLLTPSKGLAMGLSKHPGRKPQCLSVGTGSLEFIKSRTDPGNDVVGVGLAAGVVAGEVEEGFEEAGVGGGEGSWFLVG